MNGDDYTHLSFDCYGTLIDWERGILGTMTGLLLRHGVTAGAQDVLLAYVKAEAELEAGPWQPYGHILAEVARRIAAGFGVTLSGSEADLLATGLCDWPPFADTPAALARLASRYRLIILSNIDDALFAGSSRSSVGRAPTRQKART